MRKILKYYILLVKMLAGCNCLYWNRVTHFLQTEPEPVSLPAPHPQWPQGSGFASGLIKLGELEIQEITKFQFIWGCKGVSFYKPIEVPKGFFSLGHYCQLNEQPFRGFVLVAREVDKTEYSGIDLPPLQSPLDYTLVWCSEEGSDHYFDGGGYFWLPQPPDGYKALGFIVSNKPEKPKLDEIRCVRTDLTDQCEAHRLIVNTTSKFSRVPFGVWSTRPCDRGMLGKGIFVGTFFCGSYGTPLEELNISCLKNLEPSLHAMPNLNQIHALIGHYGPTLFFHPDESFFPSSVSWFFENGALLCKRGEPLGEGIDSEGSNLPGGGRNDGEYWLDFPNDGRREKIKHGNLESAKLYVHVKPAFGGTFTDIAMWVFCPFNGPATLKIGIMNVALGKVGQHVGDWEHFTLRVSNFTGKLSCIYFSQHSGGQWVDISNLEFIEGNKAIVYSSKGGHASYPHPGTYMQGSSNLGLGIRNDAARSKYYVDSSIQYEIIAAEYLIDGVVAEPCWLQFMREWGPTIVYDSRNELNKIISRLPLTVRYSVEDICRKIPNELYGEEGPSGPKEKNNWVGDERW